MARTKISQTGRTEAPGPRHRTQARLCRPDTTGSGGYTLIELSIVVFLIGLMLLIAVPRVRESLFTDQLSSAARRLVGAARELRSVAVRDQVDQILQISLDEKSYWIYSADMTPEKKEEMKKRALHLPGDVKFADAYVAGKEKKTAGEVSIRFFSRGYVEPAVIHLADGERFMTLVLHPFIHTVETHEKYLDFWQAG
ncbi:MAG TPA: prepilin-type N-terminal cleavage/methylation domain-containing protein [Syntrophales bacterium]|jgi:prepilin-type N-terminal cleavage/methylation domain-containing protein|nr:prepilin-type N-terminal cleavage/methylation domain-containing protein [Syntrophales bacterium]HRT61273.1 prepilin-type N-terminal cleavage/methylation domain-containing protein [Syntrophales bacterium]